MADLITTIKNWFTPKQDSSVLDLKSNPYNGGTLGTLDSEAFKTWFFGMGPTEEPENLTFPIVAKEAFEKNVVTYKCVMTIASSIADLDFLLYNKKTGKQVTTHPLLDLLKRPNAMQGKTSFLQHAICDYLLDGNMFIQKAGPGRNSPPRALWALQPNWVQVTVGTSRIPQSYFYTAGGVESGGSMTFPVDPVTGESDVLHIKSYAPMREQMNGRGLSPVRSAWRAVLTHNEGARWNYALLKNNARPSGVLQCAGDLTEEQISMLKEQIGESFGGSRNAGKPAVLANGLKWQELSLSPVDMAFLEGKNSVARDICLALGIPPILLHIPGDTTYNNVEQAKLAMYEEAILPKARHIIDEFNRWLVPCFDPSLELRIDYDTISALSIRRTAKWQALSAACGGIFMTPNEVRAQLGMDAIEDGDDLLVPTMVQPLEMAMNPPPPPTTTPTNEPPNDDGSTDNNPVKPTGENNNDD
jgi:HK97 family phage portal protein